ncbi:hypothetical protein NDU88_001649 [Pleurodeles waltl]|uniref:Uncharacterized protein n=1 Tax=Pleurodeles waltl TaxID=8319 RepID=A0AAV7TIE4_PLEWA|nr:hypothetical protein NDU88_001649 [Pleurodeles waltl]
MSCIAPGARDTRLPDDSRFSRRQPVRLHTISQPRRVSKVSGGSGPPLACPPLRSPIRQNSRWLRGWAGDVEASPASACGPQSPPGPRTHPVSLLLGPAPHCPTGPLQGARQAARGHLTQFRASPGGPVTLGPHAKEATAGAPGLGSRPCTTEGHRCCMSSGPDQRSFRPRGAVDDTASLQGTSVPVHTGPPRSFFLGRGSGSRSRPLYLSVGPSGSDQATSSVNGAAPGHVTRPPCHHWVGSGLSRTSGPRQISFVRAIRFSAGFGIYQGQPKVCISAGC